MSSIDNFLNSFLFSTLCAEISFYDLMQLLFCDE